MGSNGALLSSAQGLFCNYPNLCLHHKTDDVHALLNVTFATSSYSKTNTDAKQFNIVSHSKAYISETINLSVELRFRQKLHASKRCWHHENGWLSRSNRMDARDAAVDWKYSRPHKHCLFTPVKVELWYNSHISRWIEQWIERFILTRNPRLGQQGLFDRLE